MRFLLSLVVGTVMLTLMVSSCSEETPSRDQIPILKERVYLLQQAVKQKNRAALDSLMSPEILSYKLSSDSLLKFVYGLNDQFAFERFGNCVIAYTTDKARVDCFIMDSTARTDHLITFTFVYKHDLWLLKRFEPGQVKQDNL